MSEASNDKIIENIRFARQQLEKERAHRREKVWKIFSWAATILVAITGGLIALKTNSPQDFEFSWRSRGVLCGSVLFLMGFACLWFKQNINILTDADKTVEECDNQLDIKNVIPEKAPRLGYIPALVLLAIAAIITIVIDIN